MKIHKTPVMITVKNSIDDTYRLEEGNIEVWYDRSAGVWIAAVFNSIGDQIGDAEFAGSKIRAFNSIARYRDDIRVI